MLWQEKRVVHDWLNENSIFTVFDMQFLHDLAVFWQVKTVVHDFLLFKIFISRKIRAQRQFLANGWQLKRVVHDFWKKLAIINALYKFLQTNIRYLTSDR